MLKYHCKLKKEEKEANGDVWLSKLITYVRKLQHDVDILLSTLFAQLN